MPGPTPSQTVGPFFAIGLPWPDGPFAVAEGVQGAIRIHGRVLDGAGEPVPDALVETWQADPPAGDGFRGFARCPTDAEGRWAILTLKPRRVEGRAPHVDVSLFARGLLNRVVTRIYFADEDNAGDPVLAAIEEEHGRATLLAEPHEDGYRFDIHLQGERETVFFTI